MRRIPAYCVHKGRKLAYITVEGRGHYLGRAHSPESHARYGEALSAFSIATSPARRCGAKRGHSLSSVAASVFSLARSVARSPSRTCVLPRGGAAPEALESPQQTTPPWGACGTESHRSTKPKVA